MDLLLRLAELIKETALQILTAAAEADLLLLAAVLVVITAVLASGCWAASISETRGHSPLLGLAAGMLIPVIYPLIILFAMEVKEKPVAEEEEEEIPRHKQIGGRKKKEEEKEAVPVQAEFDQKYFDDMARTQDTAMKDGMVVAYNGNEVLVRRIVDALPQVAVVEIATAKGEFQKIRIPYTKITHCTVL